MSVSIDTLASALTGSTVVLEDGTTATRKAPWQSGKAKLSWTNADGSPGDVAYLPDGNGGRFEYGRRTRTGNGKYVAKVRDGHGDLVTLPGNPAGKDTAFYRVVRHYHGAINAS